MHYDARLLVAMVIFKKVSWLLSSIHLSQDCTIYIANGQPRNTGMISSVEAPTEQPRIVAAAAQIYESAPSAEVK